MTILTKVKEARASSAPGINEISDKLYKKCPRVLKIFWRPLKVAWKSSTVARRSEEWCIADGINIPSECNSESLQQFRQILLLPGGKDFT